MRVRVKKLVNRRIVRLAALGEIKEVRINEDITNPDKQIFSICFRGEKSSGVIDFTKGEIDSIVKQVAPKIDSLKNIKVMRFSK